MMKRCPKCGQTYADQNLNFCLNDGELLMFQADTPREPQFANEPPPTRFADDSPPTIVMDSPRATNPTGYPTPERWQGQQILTPPGHYPAQYGSFVSPDQTLAIISTILGAASLTIGWCCYTGLLLGPAAMITGFIALSMNKRDPMKHGGRGFGIAGIVMGGLVLIGYLLFIIIYVLALIGGGLS